MLTGARRGPLWGSFVILGHVIAPDVVDKTCICMYNSVSYRWSKLMSCSGSTIRLLQWGVLKGMH